MDQKIGPAAPEDIPLNNVLSENPRNNNTKFPGKDAVEEEISDQIKPVSTLEILAVFLLCGKTRQLRKWMKYILSSFVVVGYFLFFIAVLSIQSSKQKEDYWCNGDGFLIAVTTLALLGVLYYYIFRRYFLKAIVTRCAPFIGVYNKHKENWFILCVYRLVPIVAFVVFLYFDTADDRTRLVPVLGICTILFLSYLLSVSPRHIKLYQVYWGIGLQIVFALLILRTNVGKSSFQCIGQKFSSFLEFTEAGSSFAFGKEISDMKTYVFSILTVILFFGMVVSILYFYGILQFVIIKIGWLLEKTMGTTPCESMATAANIFLGQSEAPLVIFPYIKNLTNSEIHAVMTGGFSTVAGGVLSAYISFGVRASHLMSASIMSAPAALVVSKIMYPETEISKTNIKNIKVHKGKEKYVLHAVTSGISASLLIIANITGSAIAFLACASFLNAMLDWSCQLLDYPEGTCDAQSFLAYMLMPIAWLMGVPQEDCYNVGYLLGSKIMLTSFLSYQQLGEMMEAGVISDKAVVVATYALCGFSSLASLGCQIASLGSLAPTRAQDFSRTVVSSFIAGNFASFLTASVASTLLQDTTSNAFQNNRTIGLSL